MSKLPTFLLGAVAGLAAAGGLFLAMRVFELPRLLLRRDRQVGLTAELPEEWIEAVHNAKVPDEFAHLDAELK